MVECDSHETPNMYPNMNAISLSDHQQFRLNKINEIKDYFVAEIKERVDWVNILLPLTIMISR